jgi:hypothetical protein
LNISRDQYSSWPTDRNVRARSNPSRPRACRHC